MNKLKIIKNLINILIRKYCELFMALMPNKFTRFNNFTDAVITLKDRNTIHLYMHQFFFSYLPSNLKKHRKYFSVRNRGFGENALHSMWYLLLCEFKPYYCLEIGVYRGQIISLWSLILDKELKRECKIFGISPLSSNGDSNSKYIENLDYQEDIYSNFKEFELEKPFLLRAYSTDHNSLQLIKSKKWDLIYIDGNHDYEIVLADFYNCKDNLKIGGLLVFDDSSLYTDFNPPIFSFAGHPGPSQVIGKINEAEFKFLGGVGHNNIYIKL